MLKKEFKVGFVFLLLSLIFAGSVFAENRETNLLGSDVFVFNSPATASDIAAEAYKYDSNNLRLVGTEGGNWEYILGAPESDADIAAKSFVYNYDHLKKIGTEGGSWQWSFDGEQDCPGIPVVKKSDQARPDKDS